jgi:hypothetical protein
MVRVEMAKWGQTLEDLRLASVPAAHRRSRERFPTATTSTAPTP